jgi:hypothetical protein
MDGKRTRDNIYCTYVPSSSSGNPCTSNGGVAGSPIYLIVLMLCTTMDRTANDRCILSNRLNLLEVQGDCRPNCSVLRSTTRAIRNVILIYAQNGIYYSKNWAVCIEQRRSIKSRFNESMRSCLLRF